MADKFGTFEWIHSYNDLRSTILPLLLRTKEQVLSSSSSAGAVRSSPTALVIGCGTSSLSASVQEELQLEELISIDNDSGCIRHMQQQYAFNPRLRWIRYDLIEDAGQRQSNVLDREDFFDLIIDKGTFDAILVEGSIHTMLLEIHRLLRTHGVYVLISINSIELLREVFSIPELCFEVAVDDVEVRTTAGAAAYSILTCTKQQHNFSIDAELVAAAEESIMNFHFKDAHPLLDSSAEQNIRQRFAAACNHMGFVDLITAHSILFADNSSLGYSFDLFSEDVGRFDLLLPDAMNVEEALRFMHQMQ